MSGFIAGTLATIVTVPMFAMFAIYFIARFVTGSNKRSFHVAVDASTVFFIIAVHFLIIIIWERSLLALILTVLIAIATIIVLAQYKIREEIRFGKVFKGFWRVNFLLFFLAYFFLAAFGVIKRVYETLT